MAEGLNALPDLSCVTPKGALYAFPNVARTGWTAKALAAALVHQAGVAVPGGPDSGLHGEGYLGLSYANTPDAIARTPGRMGTFLRETRPA